MLDYVVRVEIKVRESDFERLFALLGKLLKEANIAWRPWTIKVIGEEDC